MFIVLEGIDGSGKSTHARLLARWLKEKGHNVFLTAEPTKGQIGKLIRRILSGSLKTDPRTLALLFTADRMEHISKIKKALEKEKFVISERYYYSTVAYQSAQGINRRWLMEINRFTTKPDIVFLLDVVPSIGAARTKTSEIFENEGFLKKVRQEYMKFKFMKVLDSNRPINEVQESLREMISKLL